MNDDPAQPPPPNPGAVPEPPKSGCGNWWANVPMPPKVEAKKERENLGCMVFVTVFFCMLVLGDNPTWPAACGVLAICAMVAFIAFLILRQK
jgi:hypothetical protein